MVSFLKIRLKLSVGFMGINLGAVASRVSLELKNSDINIVCF